jgi:uncharacterized protein (TIGR03435 family)
MTNHLVQSTLLAGVIALLTLVFRENAARVRHWLWMAASVKFLVPLSFLVGLGSRVQWRSAAPGMSRVMENVGRSFTSAEVQFAVGGGSAGVDWGWVGGVVWIIGFVVVLAVWFGRWRRVRRAVERGRVANPPQAGSLPHMSVRGLVEPGVFGIFRPVLLLPQGIAERLSEKQLDAIVAHEMCHIRRRDNLTAAIHMVVEALFWFHPLVWWIGARLVEERERACDEEVLRLGKAPEVYAESILKVCRLYLESPLPCVSGVTGADLNRRIEEIMTQRVVSGLNHGRRLLLAAAGIAAVAGPVVFGIVTSPQGRAQQPADFSLAFEVASIKPTEETGRSMNLNRAPGGRFTTRNTGLKMLMTFAYDVRPHQISGGASWIDSEGFDIVAKAEAAEPTIEQFRGMMQKLLADRFQLTFHRETKEMPVYALVLAKNGPKLRVSDKDQTTIQGGRGQVTYQKCSMAFFAQNLSPRLGRTVLDRTGLKGEFDFTLEATIEDEIRKRVEAGEASASSEPVGPTIFTALQEQLGLKLESTKGPVEILVIDRAQKPSGN